MQANSYPSHLVRKTFSPTVAEVAAKIKSLKNGEAAGLDEIRPKMLKAFEEEGVQGLFSVIKVAWQSGSVPGDWQIGMIVPIFKKKEQE